MPTTFHPQMDGVSECANRSVGLVLQTLICPDEEDWVKKLLLTKFTINSNLSNLTGFAPFELNYGYMPMIMGGISPIEHARPGVKQFVNHVISTLEMAHNAIIESQVT